MYYEEDFPYDGSRMFSWLSDQTGIAVDQLNFLISQIAAVLLASLYRTVLHPSKTSTSLRHIFSLSLGLIIGYFCFGQEAIHLVGLPVLCYILIQITSPETVQRWVLAASLTYLSCIHLKRQIYDYGSYRLDITGPLMVITQKVSTLAFNIHDGFTKKESEMNSSQTYYSVDELPTPLEYSSYMLMFPTIMVGPLIYYKDYINFINGHNYTLLENKSSDESITTTYEDNEPSPTKTVLLKFMLSMAYALIFLNMLPFFPMKHIKEASFLESSLVHKLFFLMAATLFIRFKYYFAWTLSDAICNNSGLGFNGYNEDGSTKWDKFSNVDIVGFEFSTNLRQSIESWNLGTNSWLRMIVYDRVTKYRTILTYALSAIWHGFYPGYYITFANGALFTFAARSVRRTLRDHFLNSEHKLLYDVVTFIATRLVMAYITFTFILLEFWPSIRVYIHMYWCLHVLALISIFVLPKLAPPNSSPKASKHSLADAISQAGSIGGGVSRHHD